MQRVALHDVGPKRGVAGRRLEAQGLGQPAVLGAQGLELRLLPEGVAQLGLELHVLQVRPKQPAQARRDLRQALLPLGPVERGRMQEVDRPRLEGAHRRGEGQRQQHQRQRRQRGQDVVGNSCLAIHR